MLLRPEAPPTPVHRFKEAAVVHFERTTKRQMEWMLTMVSDV